MLLVICILDTDDLLPALSLQPSNKKGMMEKCAKNCGCGVWERLRYKLQSIVSGLCSLVSVAASVCRARFFWLLVAAAWSIINLPLWLIYAGVLLGVNPLLLWALSIGIILFALFYKLDKREKQQLKALMQPKVITEEEWQKALESLAEKQQND